MPILHRPLRVAAIACLTAAIPATSALAACPRSEPGSARVIVTQINAARAATGYAPLRPFRPIARPARAHSMRMAAAQRLWHDNLRRWAKGRLAGQNVGVGGSAVQVFQAMWESPPHRTTLMNPRFHRVGVSAVRACGGNLMVTANFRG